MKPKIGIIVPTFNNPQQLNQCVKSIWDTCVLWNGTAELIIVNNGKQPIKQQLGHLKNVKVVGNGENIGWEKALVEGMKHTEAEYLVFQNDDTFIQQGNENFYYQLLIPFVTDNVAAVGPITTTAAGIQSIFHPQSPKTPVTVPWLIFFTVMVRRKYLDEVGGVDTTLPGGDDLDLSLRFRKAGYNCLINPAAFLIHHGFQTGTRVNGGPEVKGGWNSKEMTERTNMALIRKHGFRDFMSLWTTPIMEGDGRPKDDVEGFLIRQMLNGDKRVLDLACGAKKTVDYAIGVDRVKKGSEIQFISGMYGETNSVADIEADVTKPLPFEPESQDAVIARHILEHCIDAVDVIKNWSKVIRKGGKLIIAVPDQKVVSGIPLNPEHVHAFTEESLQSLCEVVGFKHIKSKSCGNGTSFVGAFEKC